jgi:hypothetical protein
VNSKDRPDITFFYETCFAWRGEGESSNTVVLIEFKVPGRNNYNGNDIRSDKSMNMSISFGAAAL